MPRDPIMDMLITRGHVPGMPAAGHVVNGYWHPGAEHNCSKGNCPKTPTPRAQEKR